MTLTVFVVVLASRLTRMVSGTRNLRFFLRARRPAVLSFTVIRPRVPALTRKLEIAILVALLAAAERPVVSVAVTDAVQVGPEPVQSIVGLTNVNLPVAVTETMPVGDPSVIAGAWTFGAGAS